VGRGDWYRWDKKDTVDGYLALTAHHVLPRLADPTKARLYTIAWKRTRDGQETASLQLATDPGRGGVFLSYSYNGQPVTPYLVRWDVTTPHFGGRRYWWLCPSCGRRCAAIYGGPRFLCRVCHNLTYETAQSGDFQTTIDNRMIAIRRRLGAHTGPGWPFDSLPPKPRGMHCDTYGRLAREYYNLAELRTMTFTLKVLALTGWPADLIEKFTPADYQAALHACIAAYRRKPDHVPDCILRAELPDPAPDPPARPARLTLGELATRAGVPFAFAQEVQREGLLRPDAGRTKRAKRYRGKLAAWLGKLHELRAAGLPWGDLRAWAARRFTPGHEHERQYPAANAAHGGR
jgi:hypothetical protein